MKKITLPLFLSVFSISVAGTFDGPSMQLGIGGSYTKTTLSGDNRLANNATTPLNGLSSSSQSFNGAATIGYSKGIDSLGPFNLATKLFYIIGNQRAGSGERTATVVPINFNRSYKATLQNTFGISIEPGWNFTNSVLGYLQFAWVHSTYHIPNSYLVNTTKLNYSLQAGINGFGYGIGLKRSLTKHLFAAIDLIGVYYPRQNIGSSIAPFTLSADENQFMFFTSLGYIL